MSIMLVFFCFLSSFMSMTHIIYVIIDLYNIKNNIKFNLYDVLPNPLWTYFLWKLRAPPLFFQGQQKRYRTDLPKHQQDKWTVDGPKLSTIQTFVLPWRYNISISSWFFFLTPSSNWHPKQEESTKAPVME